MSVRHIVVTGATGFVGSAVLRRLAAQDPGAVVRATSRTPPPPAAPYDVRWVNADLADEQSLRGVCEGADVLLSLASYIGPDADRCAAVNSAGAAALVAEARRAGVGRIVHLSTCAVYGPGPHRGQDVGELAPAPVSPASAGRLAGEGPVLDAGGLVLRAGLVLGRGDRWPWRRCLDTLATVPGWVSERQFTLLARDHWYRADAAWELAGITLGPGPLSRIGPAAEWYRERGGAAPG